MRIAQVSPLYESVPPRLYGGTERVVSYLTEELVQQGHEVTLFASGDSATTARLVPGCPEALRSAGSCLDPLAHHVLMLEQLFQRAEEFDIIHLHVDYLYFSLSRRSTVPSVTTLHGRLDLPDLQPLFREFSDTRVISISDAQRAALPGANWLGTVYHGLPEDRHTFYQGAGDYLAFVGRISPEKRVDRAIEIARRAEMPIKIAAKIDKQDREYFERDIAPLFVLPHVQYLGEIGESVKWELLGHARALLFPIDWCEPFGLVVIEAMACGTPVIACRKGSVPEVMVDGVTGFIVDTVDEAVCAVGHVRELSRAACRRVFEERYTAARMARDYVKIYDQVLAPAPSPVLIAAGVPRYAREIVSAANRPTLPGNRDFAA
ncbi:MAG: glycosyltransferase [Luteitalea sp.]|nr:glycosyltransferase [Luteitalea sp.]